MAKRKQVYERSVAPRKYVRGDKKKNSNDGKNNGASIDANELKDYLLSKGLIEAPREFVVPGAKLVHVVRNNSPQTDGRVLYRVALHSCLVSDTSPVQAIVVFDNKATKRVKYGSLYISVNELDALMQAIKGVACVNQ